MARKTITEEIFQQMKNDYNNGYTIDDIAEKYGFKKNTIKLHFNKHGISFLTARRFTEQELNSVIFDYQNGMKLFEIAEKYNRRPDTIMGKLQSIEIYEYTTHRFTDEEIEFLKVYYPIGDWNTIFKCMPNVSKQSIHSKMNKLGIHITSYYWTKEDERLLIENYESMYGRIDELVDLFCGRHTYKSIVSKARKLGLQSRKSWSNEEIEILINNYDKYSVDEILFLLPNRNRHSVIAKAGSLNLTNKTILETRFNNEDKMFIIKNFNSMTDKEMGIVLQRSETAINNYRYRNGLIKINEKSSYNDLSEYLRRNNADWKRDSMINCKYKCVLTGKRFDEIHHLYGLNLILNEVLDDLNISVKNSMDDYSKEELRSILDTFREKQLTYPLGVCLTKEIHSLFHKKYGYGNNTIEQWNKFVSDYKFGKYKDVA